jgi:hypothetical protein
MTTAMPSSRNVLASSAAARRASAHVAPVEGLPSVVRLSWTSSRSMTAARTSARSSFAATNRATVLLPLAIGPVMTMIRGWSRRSGAVTDDGRHGRPTAPPAAGR